jgi:hypothetical protein
MEWHVGQPIVAIVNGPAFKVGDEFTALGVKPQGCCYPGVAILIDVKLEGYDGTQCTQCGRDLGGYWFVERCFMPLDQDISELTNALTEPIVNKKFNLNNLSTL